MSESKHGYSEEMGPEELQRDIAAEIQGNLRPSLPEDSKKPAEDVPVDENIRNIGAELSSLSIDNLAQLNYELATIMEQKGLTDEGESRWTKQDLAHSKLDESDRKTLQAHAAVDLAILEQEDPEEFSATLRRYHVEIE